MSELDRSHGRLQALLQDYLRRRDDDGLGFEQWIGEHAHDAVQLRRLYDSWLGFEELLRDLAPEIADGLGGPDVGPSVGLDGHPDDPTSWNELLTRIRSRASNRHRYRREGEIGHGGMGTVYRGRDEDLRRLLAIKVIRRPADAAPLDDRRLGRFLEEAQITAQLDHPGIVPIYDLGVDDAGEVFFVMKLVAGENLGAVFDKVHRHKDGWNETRALNVLHRACEALAFAHERGVIHRDLKPSNIMVGPFGEVYVMDWGLARVLGREDTRDMRIQSGHGSVDVSSDRGDKRLETPSSPLLTRDGEALGTPAYMSPEQANGWLERLGARSDIYAVGAILYHLLVGHPPYLAEPTDSPSPVEIIERVKAGPPAPIRARGIPPELLAICSKAMAHDAEQRYPTMQVLAEDLRAFLEQRVVKAYRTGAFAELRKWIARNALFSLTVVAGTVLLGLLLAWAFVSIQDERNVAKAKATEADLARRELEGLTAREALELGRRQASYGRWTEAHEAYAAAIRRGYPDGIEVRILQIEAWEGQGDLANVRRALDELVSLPQDLGAHRSKVFLLLGDQTRQPDVSAAFDLEALDLVQAALAGGGLEPADSAYARALLARSSSEARDHLDEALRCDSRHRRANEMVVPTLLLGGRPEDALRRAREFRRLYPDDPSAQLAELGCVLLLEGRRLDAELRSRYPAVADEVLAPLAWMLDQVRTFDDMQVAMTSAAIKSDLKRGSGLTTDVMHAALKMIIRLFFDQAPDARFTPMLRLPPHVGQCWVEGLGAVLRMHLGDLGVIDILEDVAPRSDAGELLYSLGACRVAAGRPGGADALWAASQKFSLLPLQRVCLVNTLILDSRVRDATAGDRAARADRAVQCIERLMSEYELDALEYEFLREACRRLQLDELRREVTWAWNRRMPDDPLATTALVEDLLAEGALAEAGRRVQDWLVRDPESAAARSLAERIGIAVQQPTPEP